MKQLMMVVLMAVAVTVMAAPKYGNVLTQAQADTLSTDKPGNVLNATPASIWEYRKAEGWRIVDTNRVDLPDAGFQVVAYAVHEVDGETCALSVSNQVNIAAASASLAAQTESNRLARIAWDKTTVSNTVDNDPLEYAIGYWLIKTMVKAGVTNTMASAKQLILDTAYSKVPTNTP